LTIEQAAGDRQTLRWLVVVAAVALLLVVPALALLYRLDVTARLVAEHSEEPADAAEPPRQRAAEPPAGRVPEQRPHREE